MSKLKNCVKKHKAFAIFLSLVLLLTFIWSGGRVYRIHHPNQAYHDTDFIYNGEAYVDMDQNWRFIEEPKKKLCKVYKSVNSVLPSSTLYGFEGDKDHIFIQEDHILFLAPLSYMKKMDYGIFDKNCIEKIVVEHWDWSSGNDKLIGLVEFKNTKEFSSWISLIQELRNKNNKKSDTVGYNLNKYRMYFYYKNISKARYWVADINLDNRMIEVSLIGETPQYILPDSLAEMIIKEEKPVK